MSKELNPPGGIGEWCRLMGWIMTYEEDYHKDQAEIKRLREALERIAYRSSDTNVAVPVAKKALKGENK